MAEFLKFKENQNIWNKINELEQEYLLEEARAYIEEIKLKGEFVDQDDYSSDVTSKKWHSK